MFRKFLCSIGFHKWETLKIWKCRAWCTQGFRQPYQVDAETHLFRCVACGAESAKVTDGQHWSDVDPKFVRRQTNYEN